MSKQIIYLILDNGVDGKQPTSVIYASFSEVARDEMLYSSGGRKCYSTEERIIDTVKDKKIALAKLDAIDKLLLGIN